MSNPGEQKPKDPAERKAEKAPTLEEVNFMLGQLIGEKYTVISSVEDDKGLRSLDVTIPGKSEGILLELDYRRAGTYKGADDVVIYSSGVNVISVATYKDGDYIAGGPIAEYENGRWERFSWNWRE